MAIYNHQMIGKARLCEQECELVKIEIISIKSFNSPVVSIMHSILLTNPLKKYRRGMRFTKE